MSRAIILLDKLEYHSGETINGQAICDFRSDQSFRKIRIRLMCHEKTSWITTGTYYNSTTKSYETIPIRHNGDNKVLVVDKIAHERGTLPCGRHTFPIVFHLPNNIPSSYGCEYGTISYTIKVTVDIPLRLDIEATRQFSIISPIRLFQINPGFLHTTELLNEKSVCCWCCAKGNIEMQVKLDRRNFVIGKPERIQVECSNASGIDIEQITLSLTRTISYKATFPVSYRKEKDIIWVAESNGVDALSDNTYSHMLTVPTSTFVRNFINCKLFTCNFKLEVIAHLKGCHTNLKISTDVSVMDNFPNYDAITYQPVAALTSRPLPPPSATDTQSLMNPNSEASTRTHYGSC